MFILSLATVEKVLSAHFESELFSYLNGDL